MRLDEFPELLTSSDVRKILGLSSSELANARRRDPNFPAPDPRHSRIRSPRWTKPDFVRWMVSEGRAPVTVLPDLDPPVEGQPVRWRYLRTEFVTIDTQVEFSSQPSYKEQYALMRYARLGDIGEPRMLTVAFVIDEPDASERFNWAFTGSRLTAETAAALGYGPGGYAGAIVWMASEQYGHEPYLQGCEVPASFDESFVRMPYVNPRDLAGILGHPLPLWWPGYASTAAVAMWVPEPATAPTPVFAGIPPVAASRARMRQRLRLVVDEIVSGVRSAPPGVIEQLAGLGNTAWDQVISRYRERAEYPWVDASRRALLSTEEADPVLPAVPPSTDIFEGLAWLVAQPDIDPGLSRWLTDFYGYPESIDEAGVNLTEIPVRLRLVIESSLRPIEDPADTWMRRALEPSDAAQDVGWIADGDHRRRPVVVDGDWVRFHIPRSMPEGFVPDTVHLIAGGELSRLVVAFGIDRRGMVLPLPVAQTGSDRAAQCLAALALSIEEPVHLGNSPKLRGAPVELERLVSALETADHLEVAWSVIEGLVGDRPEGMTDKDLQEASAGRRLWKNRESATSDE